MELLNNLITALNLDDKKLPPNFVKCGATGYLDRFSYDNDGKVVDPRGHGVDEHGRQFVQFYLNSDLNYDDDPEFESHKFMLRLFERYTNNTHDVIVSCCSDCHLDPYYTAIKSEQLFELISLASKKVDKIIVKHCDENHHLSIAVDSNVECSTQ